MNKIRIMVNQEGKNEYRQFDILPNLKILDLKENLSKYYKIPQNQMEILLNERPLKNNQVIKDVGIGNSLITIRKSTNTNLSQSRSSYGSRMQNLADSNMSRINPELLGLSNSALNDALNYNNLLNSSMNSPEAQRKIEEIIQNQRLNDNYMQATELMPESLFPVDMLFINVEINNKKITALVDTGAQTSFMGVDICRRCNLMNMCDKRFQGIAKGVGASRIVGVIHAAQIKIMNKIIMLKINVIENNEIEFILGLDNLRKYSCNVDLKKNGLVFPDIGITAKFLSDGEIKRMKEAQQLEKENEEIEKAKIASLNYK